MQLLFIYIYPICYRLVIRLELYNPFLIKNDVVNLNNTNRMRKSTIIKVVLIIQILLSTSYLAYSQEVPIINYSVNANGQLEIEVNSTAANYYVLKIRHNIDSNFTLPTSITMGRSSITTISEPLGAYPIEHYQVLEYPINVPADTDGDNIDDITEFNNLPLQSPMNAATPIAINDGLLAIDSFSSFKKLSVNTQLVQWNEYLNGIDYLKYIIVDFYTESPKIWFINGNTYPLHEDFTTALGINIMGNNVKKGQIIYHPTVLSNSGSLGLFSFNYSVNTTEDFETIQKTHELLAANMPFLQNNLSYYINVNNEDEYINDKILFQNSRVSVVFESDIYGEINYWGLNQAEGYGFFKKLELEKVPAAKDIVLCETLPNSLPRVGGIITSFIQTPLSHVNLRAINDNIPNAFIRDPLSIDIIANLLNHYIYFKVEQDTFIIREASLAEVNKWYENIRPTSVQIPPLNLSYTKILPLDEITFSMFDGYGAKCTNVATMLTFGFPDNTIPDGFGVPFSFYQKFMEYNNFFEEIRIIMDNPDFISNRYVRDRKLKAFRKKIKRAEMPDWMLNDLEAMHREFPTGTSIRCRSSSNNEDLAGFSGAGLYDSKTQHPDEGHISKSIKQVYASLWNLRAFEEREFFRINHFVASMGVLCHPNYSDEKVNGVGISTDPIYKSNNTFYLNSQLGEDLITNPDTSSIPEEILLDIISQSKNDYLVIRHSSLIPKDSLLMSKQHLAEMRDYLRVIHKEFEKLYNAENNSSFAMDIEYKITKDNQLIIKQARPWASFIPQYKIPDNNNLDFIVFPNPAQQYIMMQCVDCNITELQIISITGQQLVIKELINTNNTNAIMFIGNLSPGVYILRGFSKESNTYYSEKFLKM